MPKFLVDENLPRSLAPALLQAGHEALDVRDCALRGAPDSRVFEYAQREGAVLISADMGFGNIVAFPLGTHWGIVIAHFPNHFSVSTINQQILEATSMQDAAFFAGNLVILEPGTIRIRRHDGTLLIGLRMNS